MKVVVVTLLLCIASAMAAMTEEQKEMLKPYKEACIAEVKIDQAVIDKVTKEYIEEKKTEHGEDIGCFAACMFKKIGFINEEGKFDEDMMRAITADQFSEDIVDKVIEACSNEVGKSDCETGGKIFFCLLKLGFSVTE